LARLLWEGSGYKTVETCFIGITHPRLEEGFQRARLYQPQRIVVLPHFLFTGVLVQKIGRISAEQQAQFPEITITNLPEIGLHPHLFQILRERELETQLGQVQMNCEMCKFRLAASSGAGAHSDHHHASHQHTDHHPHDHGHAHHHNHDSHHHAGHGHTHSSQNLDNPTDYHQRIWQVP
jgi:sirohydrochlorin cobaltochelatase